MNVEESDVPTEHEPDEPWCPDCQQWGASCRCDEDWLEDETEDAEDELNVCPECNGSGREWEGWSCDCCGGTGRIDY